MAVTPVEFRIVEAADTGRRGFREFCELWSNDLSLIDDLGFEIGAHFQLLIIMSGEFIGFKVAKIFKYHS